MDELLYLFPQKQMLPNLKFTPEDEDMVDTMTSLWVNFARTGYVHNKYLHNYVMRLSKK
jgi:carboxylesterase type B